MNQHNTSIQQRPLSTPSIGLRLALALALPLAVHGVQAQSLEGAIRQALVDYPGIKAGQQGVQSAQAEIDRAKGALAPTLSLNASANKIRDSDMDQKAMATPWLAWSVPINGRVTSEIKRSENAAKVSQAKLQVTRDDIALQVSEAWLAVVRSRQMAQLAEQNVTEHAAILGDIQKIVAVDAGRSLDLVQAQVRLDAAQNILNQRRTELQQAQEKISRFTAEARQVAAFDRYPQLPKAPPADAAQALAAMTSPALAQAQAQVEEAQSRVQAAEALHKPTLDLSLGRRHMGVASGNLTVASATFSLPIYQGGQIEAAVRSAVAQAMAAQNSLAETELVVKERIRLAYADLASAQARLKLAAQQRQSSAQLVTGYKAQFRMARRTLLELLNIQSEFASYQQAEALAQHDIQAAQFRITAALGQLAQSYSAP
jgi:adhesin transport system outer membrane protein